MLQTDPETGRTQFRAPSGFRPETTATPAVRVSLQIVLETLELDLKHSLALGQRDGGEE